MGGPPNKFSRMGGFSRGGSFDGNRGGGGGFYGGRGRGYGGGGKYFLLDLTMTLASS